MTKYAVMVERAEDIRYHLERALYLALHGRRGPVWLDVPLNVQGAVIEPEKLRRYDPGEDADEIPEKISWETAARVLDRIMGSSRPVVFGGNGVRLSRGYASFRRLADLLGVPLVTGMSSVDVVETDHPLYVGRNGGTGDRPAILPYKTVICCFPWEADRASCRPVFTIRPGPGRPIRS